MYVTSLGRAYGKTRKGDVTIRDSLKKYVKGDVSIRDS